MLLDAPPTVKRFVRKIAAELTKPQLNTVGLFLLGITLARGKRTLAEIARATLCGLRYRGSVSRMTRSRGFRSRDAYRSAFAKMLREVVETEPERSGLVEPDRPLWVLAIDDVATIRGGLSKIANGLYKTRGNSNPHAGIKTTAPRKSHTFVQGLLLSPGGARLPLARKTWRTREYAKARGKKYLPKTKLAGEIVRDLKRSNLLPKHSRVVVVADTIYDAKQFRAACAKAGFDLITPVDNRRLFEGGEEKVHARGRRLLLESGRRLVLEAGKEKTASYRRRTSRCSKTKKRRQRGRRVYRFAHDRRDVAGLGTVGVVYSWKTPVYRPEVNWKRETFKVLVCTDPEIPGELVIELYELRWEIEVFFRELKSGLGFGQYLGQDFEAFERIVDMMLLTYLFLEWTRLNAGLGQARLTELKRAVESQAAEANLDYLERRLQTDRGRRTLRSLLARLRRAG